jgi:hypothetical protein
MKLITLQITHEELCNIVICAVEGGSGYWALFKDYNHREGSVMVEVPEEDGDHAGIYCVNPDVIALGMQVCASKYPHQFAAWMRDRNGDAETSDVFLQCACFGELIYG